MAIGGAFASEGPAIVDAVVAADELPNLPHVDLETIGRFALAKIKGSRAQGGRRGVTPWLGSARFAHEPPRCGEALISRAWIARC